MRNSHRSASLLLLAATASFAAAAPAAAQYFGRNKVQYESFDFHVMKTEHFDVYFYPEEEAATRDAARMAERWYARLSRVLDHQFEERQPLVMYASHPHFQQTTTLSGEISDGTGGVTEAYKQRVIMPFAYSYEETDHVLGHELVHAFQYDISGLGRAGGGIEAAAARFNVPGWFVEGMAEYLSVGHEDALTATWLRNAALMGEIPTIEELSSPSVFPYRYGHALWAYIGGRWGDAAIGLILKQTGEGVAFEDAFHNILNVSLEELSDDWHSAIRRAYLPQLANRVEAREDATALITDRRRGGEMNLAPSISPDGSRVVFLSELDFVDVEMHLADAQTGEVIRTLQKGTALDPHFASLRYIHSAGTWSPDGRRFAFGALREAQDNLVIVDVERAKRLEEYEIEGVSEITNPTWSPDGATIVFSGVSGGCSDLYALDVASGRSRQLTRDCFADLQPSFSPDGSQIAFVTDRFGTSFETLEYGAYDLATLDMQTLEKRPVPGMTGSHNLTPQWTADGSGFFFVSNRNGIPNVYRVNGSTGEVAQLTNLFSGVSGITDVSPALTVSRNGERLIFTAFEDKGYNLYALSTPEELAGAPVEEVDPAYRAALLPPSPRPSETAFQRVASYLADDQTGLVSPEVAAAFEITDYKPKLGLDFIGQPAVGVGVGGMYGGVGLSGGISGTFSDVLGRHTVGGVLQLQGQLDEIGGALQYINSSNRLNFGVAAQRIPSVYGSYGVGLRGGQYVEELTRYRFFDTSLQAFGQYPLSSVQRFELGGGIRRISQDVQLLTFANGSAVEREEVEGSGYNMLQGSAAWVYDSSLSGFTGPIAGQRARVEVTPVAGQLNFVTALADFRRYFYLKPLTLAFRGLHFGRYGADGEGVFSDQYLGYSSMIRGYENAYGRCASLSADCQIVNQLVGSRVAVGNAEVRFPIIQPTRRSSGFVLPVDAIAFFDAGVAWSKDTRPSLSTGMQGSQSARGLLTSAGVGARVNLFNAIIFEVDYVKALQSSQAGHWVFAFQPGF